MTVLGPISPEELGVAQVHEHLLLDPKCIWHEPVEPYKKRLATARVKMSDLWLLSKDPTASKDNLRLADVDLVVREVTQYKRFGGRAIVDLTLQHIGRNPKGMQTISKRTGIHVICGCGYYVHHCHPPSLAGRSIEDISAELINEITEGIARTGVRPGVIGEIGTSYPVSPEEEKVLIAAARAHAQTDAPINVHLSHPRKEGHKVLDILEREDVELSRVALSHLDQVLGPEALEYHEALIKRGAYVEYDDFGEEAGLYQWTQANTLTSATLPRDEERVEAISKLIDRGCVERIMLSSDVCEKIHLESYGGFGYHHILRDIVPLMKSKGISQKEIETMMVANPSRYLPF